MKAFKSSTNFPSLFFHLIVSFVKSIVIFFLASIVFVIFRMIKISKHFFLNHANVHFIRMKFLNNVQIIDASCFIWRFEIHASSFHFYGSNMKRYRNLMKLVFKLLFLKHVRPLKMSVLNLFLFSNFWH